MFVGHGRAALAADPQGVGAKNPMSEADSGRTLSLGAEREIDAVCQRFEADWQSGKKPQLEDFLGATVEPARSALRRELQRLDQHYRETRIEQSVPKTVLPSIPGYELLEELGRGGMGVVYRARDVKLEREVALKCLLVGDLVSTEELDRFITEARAVARLDHPHIVEIFQPVTEHDGRHFFTMKLVPGGSLENLRQSGPLPSRRTAQIVEATARAVQHAHTQDVIHRDLKPANILLDKEGRPYVTDFGLAKRIDGPANVTRSGTVLGTAGYMAPEQAAGHSKEQTTKTDVYGLGAVLYALLTGRPPFQAAAVLDTLKQVVDQRPAPPRLLNLDIDQDLETICLKCLEKDPAQRYSSAQDLADDLRRYLRGEAIKARPPSWTQSLFRALRKHQYTVESQTWSNLGFAAAVSVILTHIPIYWIVQLPEPALPALAWISLHFVFAAVLALKCVVYRRQPPPTPDEWQLLMLWGVYFFSTLVLCILAFPWDREGILFMYPPLALLTGLFSLVLARLYAGPMYLYGLIYYLLAVAMKFKPEWAPLEFGVVHGAFNFATGLVLEQAYPLGF
jgi:serine/threonine protein kinase